MISKPYTCAEVAECRDAAVRGDLAALQDARARGCAWDGRIIHYTLLARSRDKHTNPTKLDAARLATARWAAANGCPLEWCCGPPGHVIRSALG